MVHNSGIPRYLKSRNSKNIGKEVVVYKFPFFNPLFSHRLIQKWPFSDRILTTTYDLYKDDTFPAKLKRSGKTLKEYLQDDIGLRKEVKLFADTGIFELEARKARLDIASSFDAEIPHKLTNADIFDAYDLIDPDFIVAPDEIILIDDNEKIRREKIQTIKDNLIATLDRFPRSKIFGIVQGITVKEITELTEFIADQGIKKIARGGILPLRKADRHQYFETLANSQKIAKEYGIDYIHAFGYSSTYSLGEYFVENSYDSLDTSAIYWISARRKYLLDSGTRIPVRKAYFDYCGCDGCRLMSRSKRYADTSGRFAIGLYYHNCTVFTRIVSKIHTDPVYAAKFKPRKPSKPKRQRKSKKSVTGVQSSDLLTKKTFDPNSFQLTNASKLVDDRRQSGSTHPKHEFRISRILNTVPSRILVLSNCSKRKKYQTPRDAVFLIVEQLREREKVFEKYSDQTLPAWKMYQGSQLDIVVEAVAKLRKHKMTDPNFTVDHRIISAGYGIIEEDSEIISYDSTFSKKSDVEIKKMDKLLSISSTLDEILAKGNYDLVISTVSRSYHRVIQEILQKYADSKNIQVITFSTSQDETSEIIDFDIDEFRSFYKRGKLSRVIGRRWNARGNIIYNYFHYIRSKDKICDFISFWHDLFDCTCDVSITG